MLTFQGLRVRAAKVRGGRASLGPYRAPSCTRSRSSTTSRPPKTASTPGSGQGLGPPRACRRPHRQLPNAEGWRGPPSPSEGPASQEASRSLLHRRGPRTEAASTCRNAVLDAHLGSTHHRLWGHLRDRPQGSRAVGTRVVTTPAQPPAIRGNTTQPTQGTETTN